MAQAPSVLAQRNYMSKRESEISVPVALGLGKVLGGGVEGRVCAGAGGVSGEGFVQGASICVHLGSSV